jgi:hypothetical protein
VRAEVGEGLGYVGAHVPDARAVLDAVRRSGREHGVGRDDLAVEVGGLDRRELFEAAASGALGELAGRVRARVQRVVGATGLVTEVGAL